MIVKLFAASMCVFICSQCCVAGNSKRGTSEPTKAEQVQSGHKLFKHQWTKDDPLSETGDGLGPVFNGRSCVQCHYQSGTGGGGSNEQNVDILSVQVPTIGDAVRRREFIEDLTSLHRGFARPGQNATPSITLHTHGVNKRYYERRKLLLDKVVSKGDNERSLRETVKELLGSDLLPSEVEFELTQRNTPALYGAGVIDQISEKALEHARKQATRRYPHVTGRIARIETPAPQPQGEQRRRRRRSSTVSRVGRFGWRGQVSTLDEFVRGACANELGLSVSTQAQPVDPLAAAPKATAPKATASNSGGPNSGEANSEPQSTESNRAQFAGVGLDLTDRQCRELTSFVASLPAPKPQIPSSGDERKLAEHGRAVFDQVGCKACHVERLGAAEFVFSDLLLHDMGDELSDPLPAPSETSLAGNRAGYYGSNQPIFSSTPLAQTTREWRTPPLWGVADSAPYMHDGRAATLTDAILAHGGEAEFTVINFAKLTSRDQLALVSFLQTLKAPRASRSKSASRVAAK